MCADDVKRRNYYEQKMKLSVRAKGTRGWEWVSGGRYAQNNIYFYENVHMKPMAMIQ